MRFVLFTFLLISLTAVNAQFGFIRNLFSGGNSGRPSSSSSSSSGGGGFDPFGLGNIFGGGNRFVDDGTQEPRLTGTDELFPTDCGRDPKQGTGKLCFPVGQICADRKYKILLEIMYL